jgi:osmoprotectant transport system substrate-binding protein
MGGEKIVAGLIAAAGAHWLAGCGQARPLTVGSKNFTEQVILGEIVAQHVSLRLSQRVDRKLNLGGTLLAHQALVKGDLALYPEYTGTALTTILKLPLPSIAAKGGEDAVFAKVKAEYLARFNVHWLDPLGFNNTFAMVIRGGDARKYRLETLSDAAGFANGWTLGVGYEFQHRRDGLPGLLKTYKLPLKRRPRAMDLGLLYKALEQRQVDMVAASATDGMLSVLDVKVLKDDKHYFPPYQAALAVRADALAKNQPLKGTLEQLSGLFSDEIMRTLNYEVDGKHRPVSEVAIMFLRASKLLA